MFQVPDHIRHVRKAKYCNYFIYTTFTNCLQSKICINNISVKNKLVCFDSIKIQIPNPVTDSFQLDTQT
jgi:hypothetical protein